MTYPGAVETCDGKDNDCDEEVDEESINQGTWYIDSDADGYGDPQSPVTGCEAESGAVENNTDCDDTNPSRFPGADEFCEDGLITDCLATLEETRALCGLDEFSPDSHASTLSYRWGTGVGPLGTSDFNGDGLDDFAVWEYGFTVPRSHYVWVYSGAENSQGHSETPTAWLDISGNRSFFDWMSVVDLNADGLDDFVAGDM